LAHNVAEHTVRCADFPGRAGFIPAIAGIKPALPAKRCVQRHVSGVERTKSDRLPGRRRSRRPTRQDEWLHCILVIVLVLRPRNDGADEEIEEDEDDDDYEDDDEDDEGGKSHMDASSM